MAIALEAGEHPATLVVSADGAFVTCLSAAMSRGDTPLLGWSQFTTLLERFEHLSTLLSSPQEQPLLSRIARHSAWLRLDDLEAARALGPLLRSSFLLRLFEHAELFSQRRVLLSSIAAPYDSGTLSLWADEWRDLWAIGVLTLLLFDDVEDYRRLARESGIGPPFVMSSLSARTRFLPSALMGVWASARCGHRFLPALRRRLRHAWQCFELIDAMAAWTALGLRHRRLRTQVSKELEKLSSQRIPAEWRAEADRFRKHFLNTLEEPEAAIRAAQRLAGQWLGREASSEELALTARSPLVLDHSAAWTFALLTPWAASAELGDFLSVGHSACSPNFLSIELEGGELSAECSDGELGHSWSSISAAAWREVQEQEELELRVPCTCGSSRKMVECCGRALATE
jgi:hypothetical protein